MVTVKVNTPVNVDIVKCKLFAKVRDEGSYILYDSNGNQILDVDGYVPSFFPGDHYGDYLDLHIDINTGQILNWNKPDSQELANYIEENV